MSLPSGQYILALLTTAMVLGFVVELLRRRQLREKYAVLWLVVGAVIFAITAFPSLLGLAADIVGVAVPVNLLFFAAIMLLLAVSMHLSWESSRQEERSRVLAEEIALLRYRVEQLERARAQSVERKSSRMTEGAGPVSASAADMLVPRQDRFPS